MRGQTGVQHQPIFYYRTPHESLPLKEATFRQFFRIVTSNVSLWYKDHSTPNPLGVEPDPEVTRTVVGDKFSQDGVELVEDPGAWDRRRLEVERIQAEVDQRCEMHQYYAGICDCNNDKGAEQDDEHEDEDDEDDDDDDEEEEVDDPNPDEKVEVNDSGSNIEKAVVERNEEDPERKNSKVCTML